MQEVPEFWAKHPVPGNRYWPWGVCGPEDANRIHVSTYGMDERDVAAESWQVACWSCGYRVTDIPWSTAITMSQAHADAHRLAT